MKIFPSIKEDVISTFLKLFCENKKRSNLYYELYYVLQCAGYIKEYYTMDSEDYPWYEIGGRETNRLSNNKINNKIYRYSSIICKIKIYNMESTRGIAYIWDEEIKVYYRKKHIHTRISEGEYIV